MRDPIKCPIIGEINPLGPSVSSKKIYIMTTSGRNFQVDAHEVIHDRTQYLIKNDPDMSYDEEYRTMENSDDEISGWLFGNMKWQKCKSLIELPSDSPKLSELEVFDYGVRP